MISGTITKGISGFYYVETKDGLAECHARGKMRKQGITPMVGDRVNITIVNQNPLEGALEEILPRKNFLVRPPVSNINCIVIVIATTSPSPDYFLIDKLIAMAEYEKIEVILAVNKTDLQSADEATKAYSSTGYKIVHVCAGDGRGIDILKALLTDKITAFAGNSGVGKSSILNYLGFNLETGAVSKIERGKHTTRHVELMPLENGGFVMDTPGFSLLEIEKIKANELKNLFVEFREYNDLCKFAGCSHFNAKPSACAVAEAVEKGKISQIRYQSYTAIYDVLKDVKEWDQ